MQSLSRIALLGLFLYINLSTSTHLGNEIEDVSSRVYNGVKNLQLFGNSTALTDAIEEYLKIEDKNTAAETFCTICRRVVQDILNFRRNGANRNSFRDYLKKICPPITKWAKIVCDGHVDIELDTLIYIIDNKPDLKPERVCSIIFQNKKCTDPDYLEWTIDVAPPRENPQLSHHTRRQQSNPMRILHLTDIHYDPDYKAKSNADCGMPLCCQATNTNADNGTFVEAGYWGDYNSCDMPWYSITNLMDHLSTTYGNNYFDLVYYTGDIINHNSWATSKTKNEDTIRQLYQQFATTFKNVTVFPILGNHEPHPTNFYSSDNITNPLISTSWTLDFVADEWTRWLPDYTRQTIKTGGFYTVLVRPGFRIIGLNSNVCFTSNYWLVYQDQDPYGQLKWLNEVLKHAEDNGELVHILSHIPPGDQECFQRWTSQFAKIVRRFSHIISAQFNGHTHIDEFRVFYDTKNASKVVNVAYNGASFTTYIGNNPNYKVYTVDPQTLQVTDFDEYFFNLTLANANGQSPQWHKLYSFKESYGLASLTYDDLADLLTRMSNEKELMEQYFWYQTRGSEVGTAQGCDRSCLARLLCHIKAVEARESLKCEY